MLSTTFTPPCFIFWDRTRLTYLFNGCNTRLTDVYGDSVPQPGSPSGREMNECRRPKRIVSQSYIGHRGAPAWASLLDSGQFGAPRADLRTEQAGKQFGPELVPVEALVQNV